MSLNENAYEKIELYLAGAMQLEERKAFEEELATNAELKDTLLLYGNLDSEYTQLFQQQKGEKQLKQTLSSLNAQYFTNKNTETTSTITSNEKVKRFNYFKITAAAASVALIIFLGIYLFNAGSTKSNGELYASFYTEESLSNTRGVNDSLQTAAELFNSKQYKAALPYLMALTENDKSLTNMQMALGNTYMQLAQYNNALNCFYEISNGNSLYKDRALFNIALVHLKQDQVANCKTTLKTIESSSAYYNKAQELLKQLK
jgi:hypothetical protein